MLATLQATGKSESIVLIFEAHHSAKMTFIATKLIVVSAETLGVQIYRRTQHQDFQHNYCGY